MNYTYGHKAVVAGMGLTSSVSSHLCSHAALAVLGVSDRKGLIPRSLWIQLLIQAYDEARIAL